MGCSALKTGRVCSSLGMISPAEGLVWITLALAADGAASAVCPVLQTRLPGGGGRAGPLLPGTPAGSAQALPPPGPCARRDPCAGAHFGGVLARAVSAAFRRLARWFAALCPEPKPAGGARSPLSLAGGGERA